MANRIFNIIGWVGTALVLAAVAGLVYAATTVLGRRLAQGAGPVALTTCTTTVGAIVLAPFVVVAAIAGEPVVTTDPASVLTLVYLGVATMALAYGLLYAGLRHTTGSAATVATLFEPVTAALLAAVLLGERLMPAALVGGALILAAVGVYGVMSLIVSERTREVGVRLALGAEPSQLLTMVVGQATKLAAIGVTIGVAGAVALAPLLDSQLYGVASIDPITFISVPVALLLIAALAAAVPARKAMRLDPLAALRKE